MRDIFSHLPVILAVAKARSFARAAAELGIGASAVSHAVRAVESRLGEPIFARTTRSVALTEAGEQFLASVGPALEEIHRAAEAFAERRGEVTGHLRINAPHIALPMVLTGLMAELAWAHPRLVIEVTSNDAFVDIVAEGFDAGIRLGSAIAEDMVAVRLTPPCQAIMVASPTYLAARGAPQTIEELGQHNCIGYRQIATGGTYDWELMRGEELVAVRTTGTMIVSDSLHALALARAGAGIAYLFEPLVRADLRAGELVWLMPETAIEEDGLFLYYPRRASQAPKLKALLDAVRALGRKSA